MEHSGIAGNCSGAEYDARRMYSLATTYCEYSKLLLNEQATKSAVVESMKEACTNADLTFIFYAGHGGSEKVKNDAPEEEDGKDEMIFLYDTYLLDDEIWNIISKASGRVFMIFDCCHSQTMFRTAMKKSWLSKLLSFFHFWKKEQKPELAAFEIKPRDERPVDLLCWSGCSDDKTTMGSFSGGLFTNAILRNFSIDLTYDQWWDKLASDKSLAMKEVIQKTCLLGNDSGFAGKPLLS